MIAILCALFQPPVGLPKKSILNKATNRRCCRVNP
jgi:hypothetical protein